MTSLRGDCLKCTALILRPSFVRQDKCFPRKRTRIPFGKRDLLLALHDLDRANQKLQLGNLPRRHLAAKQEYRTAERSDIFIQLESLIGPA